MTKYDFIGAGNELKVRLLATQVHFSIVVQLPAVRYVGPQEIPVTIPATEFNSHPRRDQDRPWTFM